MPLYPLNLQISGRRCLVAGGGEVAQRKVASLLACGAIVHVVSPELTPELESWAREGRIAATRRAFQPDDVDGAMLVIAATNDYSVNSTVASECRNRGILVNVVDTPELCDFYVPASFRRGDLVVSISTGGKSPVLAKRLRIALERQFGQEYGPFLDLMDRLRHELKARVPDAPTRAECEAEFLGSEALSTIAEGRLQDAEQLLDTYLARLPQAQ